MNSRNNMSSPHNHQQQEQHHQLQQSSHQPRQHQGIHQHHHHEAHHSHHPNERASANPPVPPHSNSHQHRASTLHTHSPLLPSHHTSPISQQPQRSLYSVSHYPQAGSTTEKTPSSNSNSRTQSWQRLRLPSPTSPSYPSAGGSGGTHFSGLPTRSGNASASSSAAENLRSPTYSESHREDRQREWHNEPGLDPHHSPRYHHRYPPSTPVTASHSPHVRAQDNGYSAYHHRFPSPSPGATGSGSGYTPFPPEPSSPYQSRNRQHESHSFEHQYRSPYPSHSQHQPDQGYTSQHVESGSSAKRPQLPSSQHLRTHSTTATTMWSPPTPASKSRESSSDEEDDENEEEEDRGGRPAPLDRVDCSLRPEVVTNPQATSTPISPSTSGSILGRHGRNRSPEGQGGDVEMLTSQCDKCNYLYCYVPGTPWPKVLLAINAHLAVCPGGSRFESFTNTDSSPGRSQPRAGPSRIRSNTHTSDAGPSNHRTTTSPISPITTRFGSQHGSQLPASVIETESARALVEMSRSTRTQDRGTQGDSRSSELRSATVQTREDYGSSSPISPNDWERTASTSTVTAAMTPIDPQPTSASSSRSRRPRNISGSVDPQRTETGVIRTTPGNVRNRFQPAPTSRKKNMMDERERKKLLENDEWTAAVDTHNVVCKGCGRQVSLDKRSRYYPGLWLKHRGKCMEIKRLQAMRGTATTSEVRQPSTPQTTAREESPNQRRRPTQGPGPALQQFDRGMNPRRSQPYPAPSTSTQSQGRRASTSATSTNALSLRTQVNEARGERLRLHRADFQHDARARTPRQEENEDRDEDERISPSRTRSSGTGHEHNDDDEKYSHGRAYRR